MSDLPDGAYLARPDLQSQRESTERLARVWDAINKHCDATGRYVRGEPRHALLEALQQSGAVR